jgi:hypothetical protein
MTNTPDGQDLGPPGLTPEQATAKLQEMITAYRGVAPETPQNATEAKARIDALANDPKFYDRLMRGDVEARAAWDRLNELIAADDGGAIGLIETVDSISDPNAQSRAARAALFDGLKANGFADTGVEYVNMLDCGEATEFVSEGDGKAAKDALERLSKNSKWHDKIFREHDPSAIEAMTRLSSAAALAVTDGKPVTPVVSKYIADLMERLR